MMYTCPKHFTLLAHMLGYVFVGSSLLKAVNVQGFAQTVSAFLSMLELPLLLPWALPVAVTVCVAEAVLGFLLWHKVWRPWASVGLSLVMVAFTLLTWRNYTYTYGQIESCGCFGELVHLSPGASLVKNVALLLVVILMASGCFSQLGCRAFVSLASHSAMRSYLCVSVAGGLAPALFSLVFLSAMPAWAYVVSYMALCVVAVSVVRMLAWKNAFRASFLHK